MKPSFVKSVLGGWAWFVRISVASHAVQKEGDCSLHPEGTAEGPALVTVFIIRHFHPSDACKFIKKMTRCPKRNSVWESPTTFLFYDFKRSASSNTACNTSCNTSRTVRRSSTEYRAWGTQHSIPSESAEVRQSARDMGKE